MTCDPWPGGVQLVSVEHYVVDLGNGNVLVSFLHLSALVNTHKGSGEARLWLCHIFSINADLYCSKPIKHVRSLQYE